MEGARCTFLYRGEATEVHLVHQIFGLPPRIPLRRLRGTDLWYVLLELPDGSRVEYQLEVARAERLVQLRHVEAGRARPLDERAEHLRIPGLGQGSARQGAGASSPRL